MAPVKLPRYVIFVGDNKLNLGRKLLLQNDFLQFHTNERDLSVAQEVIPAPGYDDVVMIRSLDNEKFWRREPRSNWIWADKSDTPKADDKDCLFKVVQVNVETAALQCLANSRYLRRYTTGDKVSCLNAISSDYTDNAFTLLQVTSGLSERRVFDVEYDMEKMTTEPSKSPPNTLGSGTETNNSRKETNLPVVVQYIVESKYSWRTVTTFNTGLPLNVVASIPDFASQTLGKKGSKRVKNGKLYKAQTLETRKHTVQGVAPDETVEVEIKGSPATVRVPFKYKFVDVRVDGVDLPEDSREDGVFEGEQVLEFKAVETRNCKAGDLSGTAKQAI